MAFTGEYEHTIDAKQRLAIPAELRSKLDAQDEGAAWVLAPGPNGALWLWPERTFERRAGELASSLLPDEDQFEFERLYFSQSNRLDLDKAGRIRMPERVLRENNLGSTVIVLGVRDHLELYDPAVWREIRQKSLPTLKDIMLRARRSLTPRPE